MELSLFQGCATHPVHFFPPYVQPTFPLLQISAVASWSFHRWLHPFSSQTSGGEGQQLSSPFACSVCAAQIGITTLVGLWYQLLLPPTPGHSPSQAPQGALWFWYAPKAPRAQDPGKHLHLPDSKGIWVPKCWSLPPLLCDPQSFTKSGLLNPAPRSPSLFPLSVCKEVVRRIEEMAN